MFHSLSSRYRLGILSGVEQFKSAMDTLWMRYPYAVEQWRLDKTSEKVQLHFALSRLLTIFQSFTHKVQSAIALSCCTFKIATMFCVFHQPCVSPIFEPILTHSLTYSHVACLLHALSRGERLWQTGKEHVLLILEFLPYWGRLGGGYS